MSPPTPEQIGSALICCLVFGLIVGFVTGYIAGQYRERQSFGRRLAAEILAAGAVRSEVDAVYQAAERAVIERLRSR